MNETYYSDNKLKTIHEQVEGLGPWLWIAHDLLCWRDIKYDWESYHSKKWFKYVKKFDVVLQAGGCCGLYPRLLANRFKRVYTFEPDPLSFHCLVNNCPFDHIVKLNAVLGNKRGLSGWSRYNVNVGMNKIDINEEPRIPIMKIDDLNLQKLDLIALDIEGEESAAIKGATKTIKMLRPIIIAENGHNVSELMKTIDYVAVDKSGHDTIFIPRTIK